jgi:sugar transferase (PEP-CTERM/EpsH1 system associated)
MKILLLSPWLPWPPFDGARIRIFEMIRFLARQHRITLFAHVQHASETTDFGPLRELCERIETVILSDRQSVIIRRLAKGLIRGIPLIQGFHYDSKFAQRLRTLTSKEHYDIVQIEFPFLSRYVAAVSPKNQAKKILSTHNIETIRFTRELQFSPWNGRRLLLLWDHYFSKLWEQNAIRQFDGVIATSDLDRDWIRQHFPKMPVELIPNGVDIEYFQPLPIAVKHVPTLVFTGHMSYPPNVDAVLWFCNAILPVLHKKIPNLCFSIVGSKPHPYVLELGKRHGVQITGEVPDIRPYIAGASIFVVPLRSGGGTRLKILQAMAMGKPVISTTVGAEGLAISSGNNILLADSVDQFVQHILALLYTPNMATSLANAGRRLVMEKYDWRVCLESIIHLYDSVLESKMS